MEIIILDGKQMTDKTAAHQYLARTLRFPAHYGNNLDALADCLSELGSQVCVILTNAEDMRGQLGPYADKLIAVFEEVAAEKKAFNWVVSGE